MEWVTPFPVTQNLDASDSLPGGHPFQMHPNAAKASPPKIFPAYGNNQKPAISFDKSRHSIDHKKSGPACHEDMKIRFPLEFAFPF